MSKIKEQLKYGLVETLKDRFEFAYTADAAPVGDVYKAELYDDEFYDLADDLINVMMEVLDRNALAAFLGELTKEENEKSKI